MKKIIERPYESEASYLLDSRITDKGTSIPSSEMDKYSFQEPLFEFSYCWAFEVEPGIVELVDENFRNYGNFMYRYDSTQERIYLTSQEGEETFYDIINS